MKKLLATAAFALILSACANSGDKAPQPEQQAAGGNAAVEQALQECAATQGGSQYHVDSRGLYLHAGG